MKGGFLKAGIYLDIENLSRNGGWGMRFDAVKELVEAQDTVVLRANAYIAVDHTREETDEEYREKTRGFRAAVRRNGFHIVAKEVKRYRDDAGQTVLKANADLDLAVDALLQADNLDYILLGSGDGDFLRLVRALQGRGKRVDVLGFENVSTELAQEADHYFPGALVPGLLPYGHKGPSRARGILQYVNEKKGYGFLTSYLGFGVSDIREDIFCHITSVTDGDGPVDNATFAELARRGAILEFDMEAQPDGRIQATNAIIYQFRNSHF